MSDDTEYPVHEKIDVIEGKTIYKNDGWWKAVVASDSWNSKDISVYLWQQKDGNWVRKQKYKVSDKEEWTDTKSTIDDMVNEYLE